MKVTPFLSAAVLFLLVLHGCYCQDKNNDDSMNIPNDDDDMTVRHGSGDGKYRETEEEETFSFDGYDNKYDYSDMGAQGQKVSFPIRSNALKLSSTYGRGSGLFALRVQEKLEIISCKDEFILNEYGIDNGNEDESEREKEENETERKDLLRISLLAISVGISLAVIVSMVIVVTSLVYFLQKKRASRNIKHIRQKGRRCNANDGNICGVSLNTDYEPTERDRSKPTVLEMSYYETPMAPNSSNCEYDYPINTVRSRCTKAEGYLNV